MIEGKKCNVWRLAKTGLVQKLGTLVCYFKQVYMYLQLCQPQFGWHPSLGRPVGGAPGVGCCRASPTAQAEANGETDPGRIQAHCWYAFLAAVTGFGTHRG